MKWCKCTTMIRERSGENVLVKGILKNIKWIIKKCLQEKFLLHLHYSSDELNKKKHEVNVFFTQLLQYFSTFMF